ncbi:hypothetical protein DV515_00011276 [Chloebia gouldiae]|uniref:Uncharacterized protein n=1 Tax=Chloebia gouldiae TaxID=44316 RepID=A0A3L8S7Z8_CHLGU|nr:hypothetical protein DV515_00011337 [Chloebia gouldiae]RLV97946.1 hypothetical protein DV515_00011276 [Chloebia gouldiae]
MGPGCFQVTAHGGFGMCSQHWEPSLLQNSSSQGQQQGIYSALSQPCHRFCLAPAMPKHPTRKAVPAALLETGASKMRC